ncbi:MAG: hypothetical protein CM1200mP30_22590 [Pseudomonadota bacterium]|nr:MAG: hypothetical protein CM1200mP30_22590 [Pseudomonadota bacterium]
MQAVKDQKLPQLDRLPGATRELEVKIFIDLGPQSFRLTIFLVQMKLTTFWRLVESSVFWA